jgi:hypothetical protein
MLMEESCDVRNLGVSISLEFVEIMVLQAHSDDASSIRRIPWIRRRKRSFSGHTDLQMAVYY